MNGTKEKPPQSGNPVDLRSIRPMDAVAALYAEGNVELASAILSSLSETIFDRPEPSLAPKIKQRLAWISYLILKHTTTRDGAAYRNRVLERSGHPYAFALLGSTSESTQCLVEGGDPMNGPYMMLSPEIEGNATTLDKLFLSSVQGKDVQLRFLWETKATYEEAKARLGKGRPVRLKALAAGTGLSMILAYDRLVREGAKDLVCQITDRDPSNTAKTNRLLNKLSSSRGWHVGPDGISACTEDIFAETNGAPACDVVTTVGILEYLQGVTCDTTERRHGRPEPREEKTVLHLAEKLGAITRGDACVIANTFRPHSSTRLLELVGKQFDYRRPSDLDEVMAKGGLRPSRALGAALVYDVRVYEKTGQD